MMVAVQSKRKRRKEGNGIAANRNRGLYNSTQVMLVSPDMFPDSLKARYEDREETQEQGPRKKGFIKM